MHAFLLLFALLAPPQTPPVVVIQVGTSQLTFTASPDHAALGIDGNPLLQGYKVTYCVQSAPTNCLAAVDLGKPTPNSANLISVTNAFSTLATNTVYLATVASYGPGGTGLPSASSNPFGEEGPPRAVTGAITIIR